MCSTNNCQEYLVGDKYILDRFYDRYAIYIYTRANNGPAGPIYIYCCHGGMLYNEVEVRSGGKSKIGGR